MIISCLPELSAVAVGLLPEFSAGVPSFNGCSAGGEESSERIVATPFMAPRMSSTGPSRGLEKLLSPPSENLCVLGVLGGDTNCFDAAEAGLRTSLRPGSATMEEVEEDGEFRAEDT